MSSRTADGEAPGRLATVAVSLLLRPGSRSRRCPRVHRLASWILAALAAVPVLLPPSPVRAGTVVFEAYDATGAPLSPDAFVEVMGNGPEGDRTDVAYRLDDATVAQIRPLYVDGAGRIALDSEEPVGLALTWPTESTGYSTLFLDNGGAGFAADATVNFTYRAALDYRAKLDGALARRSDFLPSAAFEAALASADELLGQAGAALDEPTRGALGHAALDAIARAFEALLRDHGLQRARAGAPMWWGFTFENDDPVPETALAASVSDLVDGADGVGYVRIIFVPGEPFGMMDAQVDAALAAGVVPMGEIADSVFMPDLDLAAFGAWVDTLLARYPEIDVWEIGNEVNGEWLGGQVREKVELATARVKAADPDDVTVLTLYWQMATVDDPAYSMFQWIRDSVGPQLLADLDVVALSTWIGGEPLGIAHDEVFERLHAAFPDQSVVMGELGYGTDGLATDFWWRSETDSADSVRRALAEHMYLANLAFPYSLGGVFWWYYVGEMFGPTPLWHAVHDAYRSIAGPVDPPTTFDDPFSKRRCLQGTAAESDADRASLVALSSSIDAACPCESFDGTPGRGKRDFRACAKQQLEAGIREASVRKRCARVLQKQYRRSTCGRTDGKQPCVQRKTNGKVRCALTPEARCVDKPGRTRVACPEATSCVEAADTDGDFQVTPADSGMCAAPQP